MLNWLWYCSNCFDSGISTIDVSRCPTCGYRIFDCEPRAKTAEDEKEARKVEYERDYAKKRTK